LRDSSNSGRFSAKILVWRQNPNFRNFFVYDKLLMYMTHINHKTAKNAILAHFRAFEALSTGVIQLKA
jgi:hypothetical protein